MVVGEPGHAAIVVVVIVEGALIDGAAACIVSIHQLLLELVGIIKQFLGRMSQFLKMMDERVTERL